MIDYNYTDLQERDTIMHIICFAAGMICRLYFIILLLYSGFTSAFYLIWPAMTIGFLILGFLFHHGFFAHLPGAVRTGLMILCAASFLFFAGVEGMIIKGAIQAPAAGLNYVIVLGAHVRPTGPSRALALRLDRAYTYALENPDAVLIVSGGQGSNEPCTEASSMKQYLMDKGLSENQILMEDQSTNTRENLIFSAQLIPDNASVGIVSNGFHICRALHLAKVLGYKNAAGIPAKSDLITQPANLLREFFAVVKDFWLL